ncbi:MAG: hypothetical protein ACLGJC_04705 [Alphaproteobacteria bacterium]
MSAISSAQKPASHSVQRFAFKATSVALVAAAFAILPVMGPALAAPSPSCAAALEGIQASWPWQDRNIGTRDRSMIEVQLGVAKYLCRQGRDREAAGYINFVQGMLLTRGLGGR